MQAALTHLKFGFTYVANGKIIQNCAENVHGELLEPLVAIVISFDIIWMSNSPKKHTIQQSICCLFTAWYYIILPKGQGLIDTQQCRADIPYY